MDYISPFIAALTIFFGCFGFLAPRYTADALDMVPTGSTMGLSELRAGNGGLFIAMGLWCLYSGDPMAYFMLGIAYAGAATGRLLSIVVDKPPLKRALLFFALEGPPAAWLLWASA